MVIGVQHLTLGTSQATKSNESWGFTNLLASSHVTIVAPDMAGLIAEVFCVAISS